jgi:hypothetical protein
VIVPIAASVSEAAMIALRALRLALIVFILW